MNPDRNVIRDFLAEYHAAAARATEGMSEPGLVQLIFGDPKQSGLNATRFKIGDVERMAELAATHAESGLNVYVEPRTVRADLKKGRGAGADTRAVFALVVDRDGYANKSGEQIAEPSIRVETSPGSAHDWLFLERAINYDAARQLGAALRSHGGDTCTGDPVHPFRLAGTPNFPNAKKVKAGRTICATQFQDGGPVYPAEKLQEILGSAPASSTLLTAPSQPATGFIPAEIEALIAATEWPDNDRSKAFAYAIRCGVERGMTPDDFEACCREHPECFAQKYMPPERARDELRRWIDNEWQKHVSREAARQDVIAPLIDGLAVQQPDPPKLLCNSQEFITNFTPPDFLIEGIAQRRFIYSLTAPTGAGKTAVALRIILHVGRGWKLAGREVDAGKALFFAGENPEDIQMRWIKTLNDAGLEADEVPVIWRRGSLALSKRELRRRIEAETKAHGPFALVVIDTSSAFFEGDDENNNAQMALHARTLRSYVNSISGGPTILVTCHPVKNPNQDNLLPRGGGAFLAEVDGNFVLTKKADSRIVDLHWHGKFRGPDFAPVSFTLKQGSAPRLVDSKGRPITTVTAQPISQGDVDEADAAARHRQDLMLVAVNRSPSASITDLARELGWFYGTGEPNKSLANRTLKHLEGLRLIKRSGHLWLLSKAGKAAVKGSDNDETIADENE